MSEKRTETTEIIKDEKGNIIKETKTIVIEKETVIEKTEFIPTPYPYQQPYIPPYYTWYDSWVRFGDEPWYRNHLTISCGDNTNLQKTTTDCLNSDDIFSYC